MDESDLDRRVERAPRGESAETASPAATIPAPIELWRDPAILRLQPSRRRLWLAYCAVPLLGAVLVLIMPTLDNRLLHPLFEGTFYPKVPGIPATAVVVRFEAQWEIARAMSVFIGTLCSLFPGIHLLIMAEIGLGPLTRRLNGPHFRGEMRISRLTANEFLKSLLVPHLRPALAGWVLLLICGWAQVSLIPARYGYFSFGEALFWALFAVLISAAIVCGEATQDFRPYFDGRSLRRRLRELFGIFVIVVVVLLPFVYFMAHRGFHSGTNPLILPRVCGITLALIAGLGLLASVLWKRMCFYFHDLED